MKKCEYCGVKNPDDAKFCRKCGKEIVATNTNTSDTNTSAGGKTLDIIFKIIGTLVSIFLIICGIVVMINGFSEPKMVRIRGIQIPLWLGGILIVGFGIYGLYKTYEYD
jgi:uncharacterized membrane protein YvbJ